MTIHSLQPITYTIGTRRVHSPNFTLERITPYTSAMGITRVADVTGLDRMNMVMYVDQIHVLYQFPKAREVI